MITAISHDRDEESVEAKARWFQSLTLEERMELFCLFTDMILSVNPKIVEQKDAQPVKGRVLVLTRTPNPSHRNKTSLMSTSKLRRCETIETGRRRSKIERELEGRD